MVVKWIAALCALVATTLSAGAQMSPGQTLSGQTWPTRPVTVVVPFGAGGPIDVVARLMGPRMSEILGQPVIVENIGGAGGMLGASRVATAAPDGYTILLGNQATHTYSQFLYKKPLYDPVADFAPSALAVGNSKVLTVRKDLPVTTLPDFVAYAKQNQKTMQFGSAGIGSATQITCVLLNSRLGVDVTHVPYRSTTHAMQDLVASRIDYLCDIVSTALPQIRGNSVKAIALMAKTRSPVLPDLPTALEQGVADVDADGWNAFFFPKGTPDAIVRKFAAATDEALNTPVVRKRIEDLGLDVPPPEQRGPDYLTGLVKQELTKWGPPIKAADITLN